MILLFDQEHISKAFFEKKNLKKNFSLIYILYLLI